jgi:hypothetical protein
LELENLMDSDNRLRNILDRKNRVTSMVSSHRDKLEKSKERLKTVRGTNNVRSPKDA